VEKYQPPCRSHHLLKLPPHIYYLPKFPSKRRKVNKHGTYISTSQTCDNLVMSIESNPNVTGSPSTPIYFLISGILSTPSTSTIGMPEIPASITTQPVGYTQPIGMNPFRSLFGIPSYNSHSIPSVSNPFSFGIPNMTSQLSSYIPVANVNPSFGPGGMAPPYAPLSFGGGHIPQTNPTFGGLPPFSSEPNPILNAPRWSSQPCCPLYCIG
jgi:hypothetical protein